MTRSINIACWFGLVSCFVLAIMWKYHQITDDFIKTAEIQNPKIGSDRMEEMFNARRRLAEENCIANDLDYYLPDSFLLNASYTFPQLYYSDNQKMIFCTIPKTGTTNLKRMMLKADNQITESNPKFYDREFIHEFAKDVLSLKTKIDDIKQSKRRMENYTKFIVVREPFHRLLSAYTDKLQNPPIEYYKIVSDLVKNLTRAEVTEEKLKFKEFVRFILDDKYNFSPFKNDAHWMRYQELCFPCQIKYDYILQFENLQQEMRYLLKKLHLSQKLFPDLEDVARKPNYEDSYAQYFFDLPGQDLNDLYEKYKADFIIFGYSEPNF